MHAPQVRSLEEAQLHIQSLTARVVELERQVRDQEERFDTLQSPLWKHVWFRLQGWPGLRDLNGTPVSRPWHGWFGITALDEPADVFRKLKHRWVRP